MKRSIFAAALLGASLTLNACGGEPEPVAEEVDGIPGLAVSNARMLLPPVEGNPAAVYFDLTYGGDRALSIRKAEVEGAESAVIHEYGEWAGEQQMMEALPIGIAKGTQLSFEPGGRHVMAMNLSPDLQPGGTTDVTLTVSGGDTQTFPVQIQAAGEER